MKEFIGVFDSGMGGVTVLSDLVEALPEENFIYFGDSINAPYGIKSQEEVASLTDFAIQSFIDRGAKAVVIACNTATSAAIDQLRDKFEIPIIGMEPAIKPAIESNRHGNIVVMATPMTLKLDKFNHLIKRLRSSSQVIKLPSPDLVTYVEKGIVNGEAIESYIEELFRGQELDRIESIVLGCTHFLYLREVLIKVLGHKIQIFDGNSGTVNRVIQILSELDIESREGIGGYSIENSESEEMVRLSCQLYETYQKMKQIQRQAIENQDFKKEKVREMIENAAIDSRYKEMILLRYGLDSDHAFSAEEIGKKFKLRGKKLKEELDKVERLTFNILKTESIYDIISQN
jgi:glutamate racemase